jgi:cell division transport system permease protein
MRSQVVLTEVRNGLRRNLGLTVAVIITVMVSGLIGGGAWLIRLQVDTMKGYWYDKVEVAVFLCGTADTGDPCNGQAVTDAQRTQIEADLRSLPQVADVFYESKQEAYQHFMDQFRGTSIADNVPPDALPESFRVKLSDPTQYQVVASAFSNRPGIHDVQDQRQVFDKIFKGLNAFQIIGLSIAALMVAAAIVLIANTIRMAAFTRRRETGIMRLVGASNLSIRLPFVLESAIAAFVGAALAAGGLFIFKAVLINKILAPSFQFTPFIGWSAVIEVAIGVVVFALVISAGASTVMLSRYLRI